jgi:nucleoid DNA-binding protein
LTKSELLGKLAEDTGLKKKDVDNVMQALRSTIYKTLKTEHKIKLEGSQSPPSAQPSHRRNGQRSGQESR